MYEGRREGPERHGRGRDGGRDGKENTAEKKTNRQRTDRGQKEGRQRTDRVQTECKKRTDRVQIEGEKSIYSASSTHALSE
jgi:hypothetical protein